MTTVLLLHHDLEWTEERLIALLPGNGVRVVARDVRDLEIDEVRGVDVLLNRVYASVANRDFESVRRALALCTEAEAAGVACINSATGCRVDYDKAFAADRMLAAGVATPVTMTIEPGRADRIAGQIMAAMNRLGGPVVFKRNTGGRGKDVLLVSDVAQAEVVAAHAEAQRSAYPGRWIVQEYARSNRSHDCRIAVAGGRVLYAFGRSLVTGHATDPEPWIGSVSRGSAILPYRPSHDEEQLAVRASGVVGADVNEIDLSFSARGPVVIEHNPTPQFVACEYPGHFQAFLAALRCMLAPSRPTPKRASHGQRTTGPQRNT